MKIISKAIKLCKAITAVFSAVSVLIFTAATHFPMGIAALILVLIFVTVIVMTIRFTRFKR